MKRSISAHSISPSPTKGPESVKKQKTIGSGDENSANGRLNSAGDSQSPDRAQKRKEKKIAKLHTKAEANPPKFFYSGSELTRRREPVGIEDIRDFVLHLTADAPPVSWIKVENTGNVSTAVVLLIPGLSLELLDLPTPPPGASPNMPTGVPAAVPKLPFLSKFMHVLPTKAPGEKGKMYSAMSAFSNVPITGEEKKRRTEERIQQERLNPKSPSNYLLTLEQMLDDSYPIPSYMSPASVDAGLPESWVETPAPMSSVPSPNPIIYALDCEMCEVSSGEKAVTHISLISYETSLPIYDTLVKPTLPITNYLSHLSGVTPEALEGVTTTLVDVQNRLLDLISPKNGLDAAILLGHSLNSDLNALKLRHPRCIDTSVIYHHPRGAPYKPSLKWLAQKWLGMQIQKHTNTNQSAKPTDGAHKPEEDARACVGLLKAKITNGPGFGEFKTDLESIFERIGRSGKTAKGGAKTRRLTAVVDHGDPANWYGKRADKCVSCTEDDEVVKGIQETLSDGTQGDIDMDGEIQSEHLRENRYKLVFGRLTGLASTLGWISPRTADGIAVKPDAQADEALAAAEAADPTAQVAPEPADPASILEGLQTHLTSVYSALPARAALVILSGHSDPRKMASLNQRRGKFEAAYRAQQGVSGRNPYWGSIGGFVGGGGDGKVRDAETGEELKWSEEDARLLEEETEKAKKGLMFVCIKK